MLYFCFCLQKHFTFTLLFTCFFFCHAIQFDNLEKNGFTKDPPMPSLCPFCFDSWASVFRWTLVQLHCVKDELFVQSNLSKASDNLDAALLTILPLLQLLRLSLRLKTEPISVSVQSGRWELIMGCPGACGEPVDFYRAQVSVTLQNSWVQRIMFCVSARLFILRRFWSALVLIRNATVPWRVRFRASLHNVPQMWYLGESLEKKKLRWYFILKLRIIMHFIF